MKKKRIAKQDKGKLIRQHSDKSMILAQEWERLRQLESNLQNGIGNREDTIASIEASQERIGELQKFIADTLEAILQGRKARV